MNNGGPHKEPHGEPQEPQEPHKESSGERSLPLDEVGRIVELVRESGVGEVSVRRGDLEVTVRARQEPAVQTSVPATQPATPAHAPETAQAPGEDAARAGDGGQEDERDGLYEVRSPLVGTFYRAPAPGESDYVQVGDRVSEGQTLCIVEAMKLMNEIPAEVSGEVVEVLADNAGGVQYDQPLFYLQLDSRAS